MGEHYAHMGHLCFEARWPLSRRLLDVKAPCIDICIPIYMNRLEDNVDCGYHQTMVALSPLSNALSHIKLNPHSPVNSQGQELDPIKEIKDVKT